MSQSYFIRKIDELGRVVIPMEIRKILDIKEKDSLGISLVDNSIFIKKEKPYCIFCNSISDLKNFNNKHICTNCIQKLK